MKTSSLTLFAACLIGAGGALGWFAANQSGRAASATADSRKIKFYQCPMHPAVQSDRPGPCTICGMSLVPVYVGVAGQAGQADDGHLVTLAPATASVIGVQTSAVRRAPLGRTLSVTGMIDDDQTRHRYVAARVAGRVEHLYVHTTGVALAAGEPFATLYSPEVLSAERLYVERLKAGAAFTASELAAARERLLALGLVAEEITRLEATRQPDALVTVRAPFAGTVIAVNDAAHEGGYVKEGDLVFTLADFAQMWFVFDAYEADLAWLRVGQMVLVHAPSRPDEAFVAPITFIDPNLDEATHTAHVRVVLDNTAGKLLHRASAHAHVQVDAQEMLLVPRSAVLRTAAAPLVYVAKGDGAYEPRPVVLGRAGDTDYEVFAGLVEGEAVVTQGALLLDGQAQLVRRVAPEPPPARVTEALRPPSTAK
ncbi:MAG: efflux RND transporter periplasmic adaptor subunit [Verrucomicrobiota bacterium]